MWDAFVGEFGSLLVGVSSFHSIHYITEVGT